MSDRNEPEQLTANQAAVPAEAYPASDADISPPEPQPAAPQKLLSRAVCGGRLFRLDMVMLALVMVLAFFLGSLPANNSDIVLHLSLGSPFGKDTGWVHHAWLTSTLVGVVYEPYSDNAEAGGRVAVIAKALLVVALAVVLCLIRRRGQSWLLPIVFAALAVVVMSPRLLLQPVVVSLLFLGVTLWVLTQSGVVTGVDSACRPGQGPARQAGLTARAIWWLPALFLLWVNMDQWFLLGPLLVALWLVGQWLQRLTGMPAAADVDGPSLKQLALVLCVGLAACLVNPWTWRAFTLPMELSLLLPDVLPQDIAGAGRMVGTVQQADPQFLTQPSPLSLDYWSRPSVGQHAAGLAYFVLLLLGAVSFWLPLLQPRPTADEDGKNGGERTSVVMPLLVVFLFFAMLSALNYRLIPFFAVVAGPITALNWQDHLRRRRAAAADAVTKREFNRAVAGQLAALAACVLLLVCAWPGWLHGQADNWRLTHHVGWDVPEDSGTLDAIRTIREIQKQTGLCKLGLCYSVEAGNLLAWSGHGNKGEAPLEVFCDARSALYDSRAEAYGKIRKALRDATEVAFGPGGRNEQEHAALVTKMNNARGACQSHMQQSGVDYVVLAGLHYDAQMQRLAQFLMADPAQWVLLYHDGRTAVFGWIDPTQPSQHEAYRQWRLDFERLAPSATVPPNLPRVELDTSSMAPAPADTSGAWHQYFVGPARPALASFQSAHYLAIYESVVTDWRSGKVEVMIAGCGIGGTAASGMLTKGPFRTVLDQQGRQQQELLFSPTDFGPPAALMLAVRAGRKATLERPDDVESYLALGRAYQVMLEEQEAHWTRRAPFADVVPYRWELLREVRVAQVAAAFQNAEACQPDNWRIQRALFELYAKLRFMDLAWFHLNQAKNALEARKPIDKADAREIEQFRAEYDQLAKVWPAELKRREDGFKLAAAGQKDVAERFKLALFDFSHRDPLGRDQPLPRGLVQLALAELAAIKVDSFKDDTGKLRDLAFWQLYLLLTTGQAREVNQLLSNPHVSERLQKLLAGGAYEHLRVMAAAALGDYPTADKFLEQAEKVRGLPPDAQILEQQRKPLQQLAIHLTGTVGWMPGNDGQVGPMARLGVLVAGGNDIGARLGKGALERGSVGELRLVRGLLALESGDTKAAARHFGECLQILPISVSFGDRAIAQRYVKLLR